MASNQSQQQPGSEGLGGGLNQGAPENAQQGQSGRSQQQGGQSQDSRQAEQSQGDSSQRSARDDASSDLREARDNGLQQGGDRTNRGSGEQSR